MTTLTMVTDVPRPHPLFALIEDWAEDVARTSKGSVAIQVFAAGELVGSSEVYDAVASGVADLGWFAAGLMTSRFPGIDALGQPLLVQPGAGSAAAAWATFDSGDLDLAAVDVLATAYWGRTLLSTTDPVTDLTGAKIAGVGSATSHVLSRLGAVQVTLPQAEFYQALQAGVIDGALVSPSDVRTLRLEELIDRHLQPPGGAFLLPELRTLVISEASLASLSGAQRALLADLTGNELSREIGAAIESLIDTAQAALDAPVVDLTATQMALWNAAVDDWLATLPAAEQDLAATFSARLQSPTDPDTSPGPQAGKTIVGTAADDDLLGTAGNDTLRGKGGNDRLDGGDGIDTADYSDAPGGVQVYLNAGLSRGTAGYDRLSNIENLLGSAHDDRLVGDAGDNELRGGAGNDIIKGKGGTDTLFGQAGDDTIRGGEGQDTIYGGSGGDILFGLGGNDVIYGGTGTDYIYGGRDDDMIWGGDGRDYLRGNLGADTIWGGAGDDDIRGGGNGDVLNGGAGDDFIVGEGGPDIISGGAGNDVLYGGFGAGVNDGQRDTFVFAPASSGAGGFDQIRDFENGVDRIDLSAFGFTDFASEVAVLASPAAGGTATRIDFGGGDVLYLHGFTTAQLDASDVILA